MSAGIMAAFIPCRKTDCVTPGAHLWEADGRPPNRDDEFWERARELIAIDDNPTAGQLPDPMVPGDLAGRRSLASTSTRWRTKANFPLVSLIRAISRPLRAAAHAGCDATGPARPDTKMGGSTPPIFPSAPSATDVTPRSDHALV
jgi:DUF2934 family protein